MEKDRQKREGADGCFLWGKGCNFFLSLFVLRDGQSEHLRMSRGGAEREGDRESPKRFCTVSEQPNTGLDLSNLSRNQVRGSKLRRHPGAPRVAILNIVWPGRVSLR